MKTMAIQDRVRKLTYDDYVLIPDDGNRHEILDGEHYVSPSPKRFHQRLVGRLFTRLEALVDRLGLGEVYLSPFDVVLSANDVVQPDLFFLSLERSEISTEDNIQGAPDLVIEILSERTRKRDEEKKLRCYERFGVREYWIVNGAWKIVTVYRWTGGRFYRQPELSAIAGDVLTTPLLPGLAIPLAELFAA
jgi:Uma2 family endonuclease